MTDDVVDNRRPTPKNDPRRTTDDLVDDR